ncbi:S9 family peptidase [Alteromonas ponticola]|uniref:S9 family peptidase n=1 Tax=Alteromonas aquimaris TaxID=2998417 RepID=A0ABT3P962_9ALTE|nr:S9 family peptidase [Alteromonas aquimaris]MCW8109322.1 S9 family peptidase [Alteromonas aquimaris]
MHKSLFTLVFLVLMTACTQYTSEPELPALSASRLNNTTEVQPPVARKEAKELSAHGHTRIDNYYWMRDDQRENAEVITHLEKENAYTNAVLAPLKGDIDTLFNELVSRIPKTDSSVPYLINGYWYHSEFQEDKEYPLHYRREEGTNASRLLIDENALAKGHDYFKLGEYKVAKNNELLAYTTDTVSRRIYTIVFKNLVTDKMLTDELQHTSGHVVWANDNQHVYYIKKDLQTLLGYQVYRHKLGTSQADDELVYQEDDHSFYTSLSKSKDGQMIYIHHHSTDKRGVSLIDANNPAAQAKVFMPLKDGLEYTIAKVGETYYILTNLDATNFRIMKVNANQSTDLSAWEEVVAHDADVFINDMELMQGHLAYSEKEAGLTRIKVLNLETGHTQVLDMPDPIFGASFKENTQVETDTLRIHYSSLTTPPSVYEIDLNTFAFTQLKQEEVNASFNADAYESKRIMVPARDGKKIPVSLVYRKADFKQDGTNPLYQYAYGSYGHTIEPQFVRNWISLLDRGFVVALSHIRGSQMLGRQWYEDGKMFNKINTFNDFIDVTRYLTSHNYADKNRVFAEGGSAGGLLMGAVANMAPEEYTGIVANVPFVDVVTTMSDETIPLTTGEYSEWGNPANAESYHYMLSYSPYDQVKAQAYPHMLITTGLHDSQVQYFEPMKWVAKLREMKTDDNLLLFKVEMAAGHGGASGRFERLKIKAMGYAFIFELAGVNI